jgi:hypothetical protein
MDVGAFVMNMNAPFSGSRKTAALTTNARDTLVSIGDPADGGRDASQRNFAMSALTGTQCTRLINASCKAFFIKRGLDPDVDWHTRLFRY